MGIQGVEVAPPRSLTATGKPELRQTTHWQEDRAVAAGGSSASEGNRGRKVRTPQGSVPDNVRDAGFKARGRPVPQKRYRLGYPSFGRASLETQYASWPACRVGSPLRKLQRRGKGEMVRQERTAPAVTPGAG